MKKDSDSKQIRKIKIQGVLYGVPVLLLGILLLKSGSFRGTPVTPFTSRLIIIAGLFIIIYSLIRKIDLNKYEKTSRQQICPKCYGIYALKNDKSQCNACNCDLEQLEGFLDRNPEFLKNDVIEKTENGSFLLAAFTLIIAIVTSVLMVYALIHFTGTL